MIFYAKNPKNSHRYSSVLISLLLVLITVFVYWQVINFDFINYDDNDYVYQNPHVQDGITYDSIIWAFTTGHSSNWHPVTWLSHMMDCQIFGLWAGGHHLTSLFFHIMNSILLFFVFRKMTGNKWQSAFVATLFALHPLHVQSVAWVSERKDVLSAFFWMLTLWAYVRYVRQSGWLRYMLILFFYILGLMSKPMVMTLPFVLLLLDYWPLNRFRLDGSQKNLRTKIAGLLREKTPMFLMTAASAQITLYAQQKGDSVQPLSALPLDERLANALISYVNYIIKFLYPIKLAIFYPYPNGIPGWVLIASAAILLAFSWAAIKLRNQKPYFLVGWFWFLGTLIPVIGLVQVGMQSMADRYMYLPMIGLLIPVAWGIPEFLSKWHYRKTVLSVSAACVTVVFLWITRTQLAYWTDTYTLFSRALVVTENNFFAYNVVGDILARKGDHKTAEKYFLTVLRIRPNDVDAMIGLGRLAFHNKNYDKALNYYQKALLGRPADAKIICMIGELFYNSGKSDKAITYYSEALVLNPSDPETYNKLGIVFFSKQSYEQARQKFKTAVRLNPRFDKAYYNLGLVASKQGKIDEALIHYKKAISLNPNYADAHKSLADLLFLRGDAEQALEHYSEALRINPDDATKHYNIGVILYHQKKIKAAQDHFYQALQIDNSYEKARVALAMTRKILENGKE